MPRPARPNVRNAKMRYNCFPRWSRLACLLFGVAVAVLLPSSVFISTAIGRQFPRLSAVNEVRGLQNPSQPRLHSKIVGARGIAADLPGNYLDDYYREEESVGDDPRRRSSPHNSNRGHCLDDIVGVRPAWPPPFANHSSADVATTRLILLAPHNTVLPTLAEITGWLRPGYYTLLVEHPSHPWEGAYADAVTQLTAPAAISAAVSNKVGHKYEPAAFAVLRAMSQGCLKSRGVAGIVFAQRNAVETVLLVRHFAGRRLVDHFPRYFLPHQRLPVLEVPWFMQGSEAGVSELVSRHFERDSRKRTGPPLRLCTQPVRAVLQHGLCQSADGSAATFLLEEVPPVVVRPVHPATAPQPRNVLAHRPAFWALAVLALADGLSRSSAEQLQRCVHCALAALHFDVATLPPGALCGDPPAEAALISNSTPPHAVPNPEYGLQVQFSELAAHPFFGFAPSRAYGPSPEVPVTLDATPPIDRRHLYYPSGSAAGDVTLVAKQLEICAAKGHGLVIGAVLAVLGVTSLPGATKAVLEDFRGLGAEASAVALPTAQQLEKDCLENCFLSSQRVRDVALSVGFQQYGHREINGRRLVFHEPWLLENNVPAIQQHYGDVFPAVHFFARGPDIPRLNIVGCISDEPGGTSGYVTHRCVAMGLRASFGHLFMVWAADDTLLNYFNFWSRDLRRVWSRMPWVMKHLSFKELRRLPKRDRNALDMRGILHLRKNKVALPEEIAMGDRAFRGRGNITGGLVDALGIPRSVFGRLAALFDHLAEQAVYLEKAIPTALAYVSLPAERLPERCRYIWGGMPPAGVNITEFLIAAWSRDLSWCVLLATPVPAGGGARGNIGLTASPTQARSRKQTQARLPEETGSNSDDDMQAIVPGICRFHPWKLRDQNTGHAVTTFMRALKHNVTERPSEYGDYALRNPGGLKPRDLACR